MKMNEYILREKLMGTAFELILVGQSEEEAKLLLQSGVDEIKRLENLLSEFKQDSVTSLINKSAGKHPVEVPPEVYQLLLRCKQISELTQGAFDITVKPLKTLYNFNNKSWSFPHNSLIKKALKKTGHKHIDLSEKNKVYLRQTGMEISFASIGKGYAADKVKEMWLKQNVKAGVINASGDMNTIGTKANGSSWKVGIADPTSPSKTLLYIPVSGSSVATSGDYEQYFIHKGKRYSHTIDPTSGLPVTGINSVSIQGVSSELCDALATAVFVMGVDVGMHFVSQLPGTHCITIDDKNKVHFSKNIKFEYSN